MFKVFYESAKFVGCPGDNPQKGWTSYITVFGRGQFASVIVTCRFSLKTDFDLEIFIRPSESNMEGGKAANSHHNMSLKLMCLALAIAGL